MSISRLGLFKIETVVLFVRYVSVFGQAYKILISSSLDMTKNT